MRLCDRYGHFIIPSKPKKQELANITWAFATVGLRDEKLFAALVSTADRWLSKFHAQDVANTAWAFAAVSLPDEKLLVAVARAAE